MCHVDGEAGEVDIAGVVELEPTLRRNVAIHKQDSLNRHARQPMNDVDRLHIPRQIDDSVAEDQAEVTVGGSLFVNQLI